MLEIILIWRLAVYIGNQASQKGLKKGRYQLMAVLLWIIGEFTGGIVALAIFGESGSLWLRYAFALLGAIIGAGITFAVAKLLPSQIASEVEGLFGAKDETNSIQKFGRSVWFPILIIVLAFSCLCVAAGGTFVVLMRTTVQQLQAVNLIIGSELDANNQVIQSTEISSKAESIYLSFYFSSPDNVETLVEFDWFVNEQPSFSFSENLMQGQTIVKLDRNQLGLSEFPKGDYVVNIHIGYMFLASTSFSVK